MQRELRRNSVPGVYERDVEILVAPSLHHHRVAAPIGMVSGSTNASSVRPNLTWRQPHSCSDRLGMRADVCCAERAVRPALPCMRKIALRLG